MLATTNSRGDGQGREAAQAPYAQSDPSVSQRILAAGRLWHVSRSRWRSNMGPFEVGNEIPLFGCDTGRAPLVCA